MANYQLPPLKNAEKFEHFVCDLYNEMENIAYSTNTDFQLFGVKGQNQKGIDIVSSKTNSVIQCKLKNVYGRKEEIIRKKLIEDIEADLEKLTALSFSFEKLIFASTFRDDVVLQEYVNKVRVDRNYPFQIYYVGWDTLSKYCEQYDNILKEYFPTFFRRKQPKKAKVELPDGALGKDLIRKNYAHYLIKRYGEWKQFELNKKGEKFNWPSTYIHIAKRYKATGINHVPINKFDDLVSYLQGRIDKTIFGKSRKAKKQRNYSAFEEYLSENTELIKNDALEEKVLDRGVELTTVKPHKSCSWEMTNPKNDKAFYDEYRSDSNDVPYLILSWTFINHTSKTIVLNKLNYVAKSLPNGLSGLPKVSTIENVARYDIEIKKDGAVTTIDLEPQIQIPGEQAFTIDTLLYYSGVGDKKYAMDGRGYIDFTFLFSSGIKSEKIRIFYNCESEDEKMTISFLY